jgi:hypothetical protein
MRMERLYKRLSHVVMVVGQAVLTEPIEMAKLDDINRLYWMIKT